MKKGCPSASKVTTNEAGFGHFFILVLIALAIPLTLFAIKRSMDVRSRAGGGPCPLSIGCPSPTPVTGSASLRFDPTTWSILQDTAFTVKLSETSDVAVNAVDIAILYPSNLLTVQSISYANSAFSVQADEQINPNFGVNTGKIVISRGNIQELTMSQPVAEITFKANRGVSGVAQLIFVGSETHIVRSIGAQAFDVYKSANDVTGAFHVVRLLGDLNDDNAVDIFDLGIFLANWHTFFPIADLNHDNSNIDIFDMSILLANFKK